MEKPIFEIGDKIIAIKEIEPHFEYSYTQPELFKIFTMKRKASGSYNNKTYIIILEESNGQSWFYPDHFIKWEEGMNMETLKILYGVPNE